MMPRCWIFHTHLFRLGLQLMRTATIPFNWNKTNGTIKFAKYIFYVPHNDDDDDKHGDDNDDDGYVKLL